MFIIVQIKFLSNVHRDLCARKWVARVGGSSSQFVVYYEGLSAEQKKVCRNTLKTTQLLINIVLGGHVRVSGTVILILIYVDPHRDSYV